MHDEPVHLQSFSLASIQVNAPSESCGTRFPLSKSFSSHFRREVKKMPLPIPPLFLL